MKLSKTHPFINKSFFVEIEDIFEETRFLIEGISYYLLIFLTKTTTNKAMKNTPKITSMDATR